MLLGNIRFQAEVVFSSFCLCQNLVRAVESEGSFDGLRARQSHPVSSCLFASGHCCHGNGESQTHRAGNQFLIACAKLATWNPGSFRLNFGSEIAHLIASRWNQFVVFIVSPEAYYEPLPPCCHSIPFLFVFNNACWKHYGIQCVCCFYVESEWKNLRGGWVGFPAAAAWEWLPSTLIFHFNFRKGRAKNVDLNFCWKWIIALLGYDPPFGITNEIFFPFSFKSCIVAFFVHATDNGLRAFGRFT